MSQDSLSCDSPCMWCFPQHKHTALPNWFCPQVYFYWCSSTALPCTPTPHYSWQLWIAPAFQDPLQVTMFFVTGIMVFTSYTSSSCSSGLLAALPALLCKYFSSFTNTTPAFWLFYWAHNYLSNYSSHEVEYFLSLCCPAFSPLVFTDVILLFLHTGMVVNQVCPAFHFFNLQVFLIMPG